MAKTIKLLEAEYISPRYLKTQSFCPATTHADLTEDLTGTKYLLIKTFKEDQNPFLTISWGGIPLAQVSENASFLTS